MAFNCDKTLISLNYSFHFLPTRDVETTFIVHTMPVQIKSRARATFTHAHQVSTRAQRKKLGKFCLAKDK